MYVTLFTISLRQLRQLDDLRKGDKDKFTVEHTLLLLL